jgi:hypothetical protein
MIADHPSVVDNFQLMDSQCLLQSLDGTGTRWIEGLMIPRVPPNNFCCGIVVESIDRQVEN